MFDSTTLSAVIVGVSAIFAAGLIGYVIVLREWISSTSTTFELTHRPAALAQAQLDFVRGLSASDLMSGEEANRRRNRRRSDVAAMPSDARNR